MRSGEEIKIVHKSLTIFEYARVGRGRESSVAQADWSRHETWSAACAKTQLSGSLTSASDSKK